MPLLIGSVDGYLSDSRSIPEIDKTYIVLAQVPCPIIHLNIVCNCRKSSTLVGAI